MKRPLAAVGLILAAILLSFAWLGYFGGDPFTDVMPRAAPRRDVAAVVMSGDMGFKVGMGRKIAARLADEGIAVVGVNSLTAFNTRKTPQEATALVEQAMQRAEAIGHAHRVILIGQSYGADMLHVGLAGLPRSLRGQVAMTALVVPGATVEFRASPGETLTFAMAEDDAMPTARTLDWTPLLCVFGEEEEGSLCPLLWGKNVHAVSLPGGHPLHYDADAVFRELRGEMERAGIGTRP